MDGMEGCRGIDLLILNLIPGWGTVVSSMPQSLHPNKRALVLIE
jgi:hypothetical protein